MPASCKVKGNRKIGAMLQEWHGDISDPIYAVGSHWYAGHAVSCDSAVRALKNLKLLRSTRLTVKEKRSLGICISALQKVLRSKGID
jgi:hypothetical protein